ncbi:UPF0175 family protein [Candidatus Woesearchaeota archaeon]|nr:UPF0175 family protein [Candidatus Woesearchaeota archaeon]
MNEAIGIRLDREFLRKIEEISKEEVSDRSTTIRKLIQMGYNDVIKRKAVENYIKGKITISEAANMAELTIWEIEQLLIEQGYKSSYSIEDLGDELKKL